MQHVIDGTGRPQIATNYQIHSHPNPERVTDGPTMENEAFWRSQTLAERLANHGGRFTVDDLKANNDCVNVHAVIEAAGPRVAASAATFATRTLWHGRYDQHAGTADFRFYLGDGAVAERRSDYLRFGLDAARVPVTNA